MKFPTMEEIQQADLEQLACWCRFLPGGGSLAQKSLMTEIVDRFRAQGGWNPELSKKIGWDPLCARLSHSKDKMIDLADREKLAQTIRHWWNDSCRKTWREDFADPRMRDRVFEDLITVLVTELSIKEE